MIAQGAAVGGEAIACLTLYRGHLRLARTREPGPGTRLVARDHRAAAMRFACPGGCKRSHPIGRGQLIIEHQPHEKPKGRGNWRNRAVPVVVILCGPCAGRLVAARAKATP